MPYKTNLQLFGPVALAYLMDGPKPQPALDRHVPISVLEQLRSAGMVKRKMLRHGSVATAWWYMADEEAPAFSDTQVKLPPRFDDPDIFDRLPTRDTPGRNGACWLTISSEGVQTMVEPTLYERLGGIYAIAAVVDHFSDLLLRNQTVLNASPELKEWHTVTYPGRLPGLKFLRTLWVASLTGGPFQYTARELRDAHFDLKISPEVFDAVSGELSATLDHFNVPAREKEEVLAAFNGWRGEVTAGSEPGDINWRRWR
jgi:hemoglobin